MRRVLIVEDSNAVRTFVRSALEEEDFQRAVGGFDVVEAVSGFEAMAQLSRGVFACIVTDINMGDINGLEIVNFVRKSEAHKETPVVIISTQSSQRDIDRGLALGANAYLPKPFSAEALCDVVRRFVAPGEG
jgi:two-component system chemotaxis response regulator CheY